MPPNTDKYAEDVKELCGPLFRNMIYNKAGSGSAAMQYVKNHEEDARKALEKKIGLEIQPSGFWIDSDLKYLGESPDSLTDVYLEKLKIPSAVVMARKEIPKTLYSVNKAGIVEVECPMRAAKVTVEVAFEECEDLLCIYDKKSSD